MIKFGSSMMKTKRILLAVTACLLLSLVALVAAHVMIQREIERLKPRLVEYANHRYGLDVKVDDLGYAFPDGVRSTGLRISFLGNPMVEAATATFRIRLADLFRNRSLGTRSLRSVNAEAVKVRRIGPLRADGSSPAPPALPERKHRPAERRRSCAPGPIFHPGSRHRSLDAER
jgi:hypothetical protein